MRLANSRESFRRLPRVQFLEEVRLSVHAQPYFQPQTSIPRAREAFCAGHVSAYNDQLMQEGNALQRRLWRNTPNAISIARLCATSVLLASVLLHRIEVFKWLLLGCLLSDILDGLIARTFHLTSKLGASLDSIADAVTMFIGLLGVLVFEELFVLEHYPELLLVVAFYAVELIASLWRYGRLSSFHTLLDRIAAYMGGIFVMSLFLWGYSGWLFHLIVIVYIVALSEEMLLIYLLPEWRSDVGGIYRVLAGNGVKP
jgi:CDP-diacylglycerol--glycerol-3-phosphate 3-phosphatidyltransferase